MVAICGNYLENNLSLQAIWLEFNWSMTDRIYSVSRWLIFFCCCIWHTCNCFLVSLLNRMFAFMLHSEYTPSCFMAKSVLWLNFQGSSNNHTRQTFHCFVLNSFFFSNMSCRMTKLTKWHVRPLKTQISRSILPVWSQSSLSAWRKLGSLATHWAHSEDWSDWMDAQADLSLCWAHMSVCWLCQKAAHMFFLFICL